VRAFYKARTATSKNAVAPFRPDALVVLGGDGAILAAVRAFADEPVPTLGINFGRVGFLASAESSQWQEAIEELLTGRSVREPRMRLEAHFADSNGKEVRVVALNDVVLTRGAFQGMLTLSLKVGGDWLTHYRADGLIVATPSGSTAYSLAAGGPLVAPSIEGVVVTPVCPQALSHRAIVLGATEELEVVVEESSGVTTLVVDGQGFFQMQQGDRVILRRHPVPWPLLARPGVDPYRRWRERLGWRGSVEPDAFPPRDLDERADEDQDDHGGSV
ncbi:MAG: NAD(+)/NADH kinase, partial [Planctomycetes bacterium]|nr:NAD(+)/NADH kinase [Planctomycetota bacterium]